RPLASSTSLSLLTDPAPSEIYTLSLHDALPIFSSILLHNLYVRKALQPTNKLRQMRTKPVGSTEELHGPGTRALQIRGIFKYSIDRKSTRLNSSHVKISYAVFCLKKKNYAQKSA